MVVYTGCDHHTDASRESRLYPSVVHQKHRREYKKGKRKNELKKLHGNRFVFWSGTLHVDEIKGALYLPLGVGRTLVDSRGSVTCERCKFEHDFEQKILDR